MKKFCRKFKRENKKDSNNDLTKIDSGNDNFVVIAPTDEHMFCCDGDIVNLAQDDLSWAFDSGASCHVSHEKTSLHLILLVTLEMLRRVIVIYQRLWRWRCTSEV